MEEVSVLVAVSKPISTTSLDLVDFFLFEQVLHLHMKHTGAGSPSTIAHCSFMHVTPCTTRKYHHCNQDNPYCNH